MSTKEQYHAGAIALRKQADREIAQLDFFIQGMARSALSDERLANYARVAIDAAYPPEPSK